MNTEVVLKQHTFKINMNILEKSLAIQYVINKHAQNEHFSFDTAMLIQTSLTYNSVFTTGIHTY